MRTSPTRVGAVRVPAILLLVLSSSSSLFAQPSKSADVAKQLGAALDAAKLEAIAAADPADPTQFVAALYFQGGQLLVVAKLRSASVRTHCAESACAFFLPSFFSGLGSKEVSIWPSRASRASA